MSRLADFRQQATLELRHEIAVSFQRFQAQHAADGVPPEGKDPEEYVASASSGTGEGRRPGAEPSLRGSDSED